MVQLGLDAFEHKERVAEEKYVEMFHKYTPAKAKKRILESFSLAECIFRILVCTIAFGMGKQLFFCCVAIQQLFSVEIMHSLEV